MSLQTPTTAEISANIIAQLETTLNQTIPLLPKSFLRVLSKTLGAVFILLYKYGGFIFLQQFVATASIKETIINGVTVKPLVEWGRLIGIGFQIWDDYLDLKGKGEDIGKPVGSDIKNGKRTLMVVYGLERMDKSQKERFFTAFGNLAASDEDIADAINVLEDVGAIGYAGDLALSYAEKAKKLLEPLPESESKNILFEIADYMVKREK